MNDWHLHRAMSCAKHLERLCTQHLAPAEFAYMDVEHYESRRYGEFRVSWSVYSTMGMAPLWGVQLAAQGLAHSLREVTQ